MSIQCITFDLDDTLWAVGPVIVRAEERFYQWLSLSCPRITRSYDQPALTAHRRQFIAQFPDLAHDLTATRTRWIECLLEDFDYHDLRAEDVFRVFWEHRNAVQLFDEVAPALDSLCTQYRLGVITNGNACVEHIGIGHWFEFVISSEVAGHSKPAPQIFHSALASAGVAASRIVHVGDDPTNDVLGAAAIGMRTVWYNPDLLPWPGGDEPDAVISTMSQLPDVLRRIGA